jgi:hypothetical protein
MRAKRAKEIKKIVEEATGGVSTLKRQEDGSLQYEGFIREYRDAKKKYNKGDPLWKSQ